MSPYRSSDCILVHIIASIKKKKACKDQKREENSSPQSSCIQAHVLYTVAVLQKKKSAMQAMQLRMSTMESSTKKKAALKAPDGMELKSEKAPLQLSSRFELPSPMQ